ncbi:MAG: winged helix-turn-helix transcriptional regulator [Acidimicrobiia bacterium]|nr:winged helix-turn-helix transcriptional regulator [Acidimicrobiia bacterium]
MSFVDVSGVAEIDWPRIRVSSRRFGRSVQRQRASLPLQKGHAAVTQELLVQALEGSKPWIGELAASAGVSVPTASKAVSQLEAHGLVVKHRDAHRVSVEVVDPVGLAQRLADRTGWPGEETVFGYLWGRTVFDVASRLSAVASRVDVEIAVTGRVGAAYLGVFGTTSPKDVRAWVGVGDRSLENVAEMLGLEPATDDAANVVLSNDRWGVGVNGRLDAPFDDLQAWVAHPLRVWCDLPDEQRGSDYAAQMWSVVTDGS